jgi:predicted CXXCH cytochrome family protein
MDVKNYALRPLYVIICLVIAVLAFREFYVPKDFGIHGSYMYGWHRKGNEEDWKAFKVKYKFDNEYCKDCHSDKYDSIMQSPHAIIKCENCHGPAFDHPTDPSKLTIDRSRGLCIRCHASLPYPQTSRANIRGIDPDKHNAEIECSMCHNPHNPSLEGMK